MVFELRPADLEAEGLAEALRKQVDLLRPGARRPAIELRTAAGAGARRTAEREVLPVAQEALANALQHAAASAIEVTPGRRRRHRPAGGGRRRRRASTRGDRARARAGSG